METIGDCPSCGKRSFMLREVEMATNYFRIIGRCYACGYECARAKKVL